MKDCGNSFGVFRLCGAKMSTVKISQSLYQLLFERAQQKSIMSKWKIQKVTLRLDND
jgi:hypothetical protein